MDGEKTILGTNGMEWSTDLPALYGPALMEQHTSFKQGIHRSSKIEFLEHEEGKGYRQDGCLSIDCSRRDLTLTRFLSGHSRSLTFSVNSKCFEICPKCTAEQATPDHILARLGLSQQDLVPNPLLTLDFFRVHRLMDLI
ncbi:hypothetical protein AVEN_11941-1 [Araneus ventricosus]|uniref:Uncharacterized protein n=1 Tax=Araneus ventricosus TaxID=182803 RepID=A0A4Y2L3E4_ARAVE|nr:hypothetical protein AVEN_11941-1 [Araneus ventricosus]